MTMHRVLQIQRWEREFPTLLVVDDVDFRS